MAPKKNVSSDGSSSKMLIWTPAMDETLVDAFLSQYNMGLKVNGTFITKAYENILAEMTRIHDIKIEKTQIKSRWKLLKKHFSEAYDIFKNGMSGFTIDPITKAWTAEPEVWDDLIKVKPQAKMFMQAPVPYYDKMVILYGQDRATGDQSTTASELRKRPSSIGTDNDYNDSTTDSHVRVDDDAEITSNSNSKSTKKSKKSIAKERDILGEEIKEAIEKVADAIITSFLARKLQYLQARLMKC